MIALITPCLPERDRKVEVFPARAWPTKHSFTEWSGCTPWPWPHVFGDGETTGCKVWKFTPFQNHFKCLEMFDDGHDGHDGLQLAS